MKVLEILILAAMCLASNALARDLNPLVDPRVFSHKKSAENDPINMICRTDPPTTSILFQSDDLKRVNVAVFHHNGVDFAPIGGGIITPYDLDRLTRHAEIIKQLGSEIYLSWNLKDCFNEGSGLYTCFNVIPTEINGIKIDRAQLFTTRNVTYYSTYKFDYTEINIDLEIGGETVQLKNDYYDVGDYKECFGP